MERQVMCDAFAEARRVFDSADSAARECIRFSRGRLRVLPPQYGTDTETLSALKRELRAWDISKRCWKAPR
jgi:hypothetical protein